ncbi:CPBP family intramembrane glutamic endopeptidase [Brevibacillus choshinensis]|uniref:CPBP family intramembrane metalloprotease n=1 Tax=Brevibacillus choshinensis TaxID=54911 RepID=A0ABX7FMK1_BRECH|nr:type II CAAX endopeptidase family protein [Brevibacillus choshinensis]QRG66220.1 CPBP family intramembrane metalloprotease [Brevibacillus choshinensis]
MYLLILLLGPTVMIYLGLQVLANVPITFLLFYSWLFLVPLLDLRFLQKKPWSDAIPAYGLALQRKNLLIGSATGVLFLIVIIGAGSVFHPFLFDREDLIPLLERWHFSGNQAVWLIAILMFINPLLEELYWRGFMHHRLQGRHGKATVVFLTALFYSLYHFLSVVPLFAWPFNVMMVAPVFIAGLIWGCMRQRDSTITGSVLSHILADVGIMSVYLLFLV